MGVKAELARRVSEAGRKRPEYAALLKLVAEEKVRTLAEVRVFLQQEIEKNQGLLGRYQPKGTFSREGTALNRKRVEAAKWLDALKVMQRMVG